MISKLLRRIWLALAICLPVLVVNAAMAQQAGPQSQLESDLENNLYAAIRAVEDGVEFSLTNTGDRAISLLTWETPFESELTGDVFAVSPSDGGNRSNHARLAIFSGRMFKRAAPEPQDFIDVAAGQTITSIVSLANYYHLKEGGGYHVSFHGALQIEPLPGTTSDRSVRSFHQHENLDAVYMSTGSVSVDLTPVPEVLYAQAEGYSSCSASQLAEVPLDFNASEVITREAREALENLPENERAGSPRYLKWFGTYDSNRYASVLDVYRKAEAIMAAGEVEFVCDCDEPYFAFIRRTEPFKVNLCTYYWRAAQTGADSRAGTILHELSHFNEIGGTSDYAYGASDVTELAEGNPSRAIANADSIEYFAENTPFVELSAGVTTQEPVIIPALQYGSPVSGSVARLASVIYQVAGADLIELTTLSGDADLYLYSDSGRTNEICRSRSPEGVVDVCEVDTIDIVYVDVRGYMASDYSIVALQESVDFQVGQSQTFDIREFEQQHYAINGASFIQIDSLSGDADLYVYSSAARNGDVFVCDSRNISSNSTIDLCEVSGTAFVSVYGLQAGQYTLSALTSDPRVQVEVVESEPPTQTVDVDNSTVDDTTVDTDTGSNTNPDEGAEPIVVTTETGSTTDTNPDTNADPDAGSNTGAESDSGLETITVAENETATTIGANDPNSNNNSNNSDSGGGSFGASMLTLLVLLLFGRRASARGVIR